MGFMIARVARFYGFSDPDIMAMPLKRFMSYARNVGRVAAEEDVRTLVTMSAVRAGGKWAQEHLDKLTDTIGVVAEEFASRVAAAVPRGMPAPDAEPTPDEAAQQMAEWRKLRGALGI